jgi:hypothetical protein
MAEPEIREALTGKHAHPVARALVSLLECRIGNVRAAAEQQGCKTRDELCGAARVLVQLREELVAMLNADVAPSAEK